MAGATGELAVLATAGAGRGADESEPMTVSRTLVRRVMDDGRSRLLNDVAQIAAPPEGDPERSPQDSLAGAPSLAGMRLRSLACAPLRTAEGPLGALWAETVQKSLEEEDLSRLDALAGLASGALAAVRRAEWLETENRRLRGLEEADHDMVGDSPAMVRVYDFIARAAPSDATVLIRGESGTGKELVARALHRSSRRSEGPFVAINCATLSETLLESELFGHEKGAFTGALVTKPGKLEVAHRGTVFLDEIGEIPLPLQAKLLRALELREFERVGGTRPIRVDVRLLAATHRDLEAAIGDGSFRQDLFYRLNVLSVTLPQLAERREDIALLARHFAARCAERQGRRVTGLTPAAREALLAYGWPGNVRELANAVERAVVLGEGEQIRLEDLPETIVEGRSRPTRDAEARDATYHEALDAAKRRLILEAVEAAGGRYVDAAKLLDLHPNYLHRLIRNLGLKEEIEERLGR
jgi:Nif-specific regulatory protein